jgi:metal-responsive CopG/Arc/MetJ family transcriptional regulator
MKLAISLPDPLAEAVDALAKRRGLPRSRIIASAIADYLARQAPSKVTERLDAVYALDRDSLNRDILAAGRKLLSESEW